MAVTVGHGCRRSRHSAPDVRALVGALALILSANSAGAAQRPAARADESVSRAAARAIAHGRYADAEALARAKGSSDPSAVAVLARLAVARGRYDDALTMLAPAAAMRRNGDAALELGLLQMLLGRKDAARETLAPIVAESQTARTAEDLLRVARAARALGQFRTANALFRDALAAAPGDPEINTAWGDLFLEKFQFSEAATSFREALKSDPDWAPAHLGLARAVAGQDPPAAVAGARRALSIDGALTGAHLLLAESALDDDNAVEARSAIDRALAVNPNSLDAHALLAAMAYVDGRTSEYDAEIAKTLAINPVYGDVYRAAGNLAAQRYRFDEAVALLRKAVALEPDNMRAYADLGMHLLRTGDEREARRVLEHSFGGDPYDIVTFNLLQMLDTLDTFKSVDAGAAVVRLAPAESTVLALYAPTIVDEALAKYRASYQFTPRGPIVVEVFPKHDDFAVRTLGLPGMLGALGACFGRVVTLDSPHARESGTFNWQATLWHELAHVFTIQMSNARVPRWLTEGVSVFEEGRVRPEWARDSEVGFAAAYDRGKVLKLKELNTGFTNPETIALAYFQASLVVELIVDRYGDAGLHALLRAYGEGLETDAAMTKALGVTLDDLQAAFDARLAQRFATVGRALRVPDGVDFTTARDAASVRALASRYRDSYPVQMSAGQTLAAAGDLPGAVAAFARASALVPMAMGPGSPRARLAALAEKMGDHERARRELQDLVAYDHTNVEAARELAALADQGSDDGLKRLAYERIVTIDPFDASAHTGLGRLAVRARDLPVALREFQAAIAAGPVDPVSAQCDLGETYLAAGRKADAKRAALAALEIAPTYARAQELLLKCVEGGSSQ